jgi:hypothetical protein
LRIREDFRQHLNWKKKRHLIRTFIITATLLLVVTLRISRCLDGKLTVGFNFGPGSQAFLNDVEIWMTAPADGHNYAGDYAEFNTDINRR